MLKRTNQRNHFYNCLYLVKWMPLTSCDLPDSEMHTASVRLFTEVFCFQSNKSLEEEGGLLVFTFFFFLEHSFSALTKCLLWIFYLSSTVMDLLMSTKQGAISCTSSVCCSLFPNTRFQSSRKHKRVAIESWLDQTSMIPQKVHDKCNSNSDFEVCFHQLNNNINELRTQHGQKHLLKPKQCTLLHLCNDSDKLRNTITKCWKLEPYTKTQMPCIAVAPWMLWIF